MPPTRTNPFAQFAFGHDSKKNQNGDDNDSSDATVDYDDAEVRGETPAAGSRPSRAIEISDDDDNNNNSEQKPTTTQLFSFPPPPPLYSTEVSPLPSRRSGPQDDDDDEDDLAALGCVSSSAATTRVVSSAVSPVISNPNLCMPTSSSVGGGALPRSIRSLHWHSPNSGQRRLIMELFCQQFGMVLNASDELRDAFTPFARPKALAKVLSLSSGSSSHGRSRNGAGWVLQDAPILTPDMDTGSLGGFKLRSYQLAGVQFLLNCFHRGMSAILGDDMGLGKTAQICSLLGLLHRFHNIPGPHLLIVPLTTISSWMRELSRWAPSLHVVKCQGNVNTRQTVMNDRHNRFSVFITTSQTFVTDRAFYKKRAWVCAVVDEAHILKGEKTQIALQVRKIDACCRIAVTGTPVHNKVSEVWSLLAFLYPFLDVASSSPDALEHPAADCARLLQYVMLRRTKGSLEELGIPPKEELPTVMVKATTIQRSLFDLVASKALLLAAMNDEAEDQELDDDVDEDDGSERRTKKRRRDPALTAARNKRLEERKRDYQQQARALYVFFTRQRHICNHPLTLQLLLQRRNRGAGGTASDATASVLESETDCGLGQDSPAAQRIRRCGIPIDEAHIIQPSGKMRELDSMLTSLHSEGHRVLIFSNFTTTLDLIEGLCILRGHHYDRLDGSTSRVERELSMMKFNHKDSKVFVFLLTTPAGGVGVTLTGADTVILFDAHYNPQIDRQAMDRAHRIGQTKTVRVYRLCVQGSMEEQIQRIAQKKARLGDAIVQTAILGGGAAGGGHGKQQRQEATEKSAFSVDQLRKMFLETSNVTDEATTTTSDLTAKDSDTEACSMSQAGGGAIQQKLLDALIELAESMSAEDAMHGGADEESAVDEVMRYLGLGGGAGGASGGGHKGAYEMPHTHVCFNCGERMRPLEPLYHCSMCTKAYHPDCIPENFPKPGANGKAAKHWNCPRHACALCEKPQNADGALFACSLCSNSLCVDCMDSRYFTLAADGVTFSNISHAYFGMEGEGMPVKRSVYYITCMRCAGVESSTSSEADDVSDGDEGSGFESDDSNSSQQTSGGGGTVAAEVPPATGGTATVVVVGSKGSGGKSPLFLLDDEDE